MNLLSLLFFVLAALTGFAPQASAQVASSTGIGVGGALAPRYGVDFGVSFGRSLGVSYTELSGGLTYRMFPFLFWRNALFYRFQDNIDNYYGLDTSLQAVGTASLSQQTTLTGFGGPGYRFANGGRNVPFLTLGAVLNSGNLSIGGGAQFLLGESAGKDLPNETQYFLILAGRIP